MKKALSLMLALVLAFGVLVSVPFAEAPFSIIADAAGVESLTFSLNSDRASYAVIDCNEYVEGSVSIPSEYKGLPVTKIGNTAFYNCIALESVAVPETVTEIGNSAFSGCVKLTDVKLSENVKSIGKWTFYNCKNLKSVVVPKNVKSIPYWCFANCYELESVEFSGDVLSVDRSAFKSCNRLEKIELPNTVATIGENAFDCAGVRKINLPENISVVDCSVFVGCADLEYVWFPDGIKTVSSDAFDGCEKIEDVYYAGDSGTWGGISFGSNNEYVTEAKVHYEVSAEDVADHYVGKVTVEPGCLTEGVMTYTCQCGHDYTEAIPALGHNFTTEWTVEAANCVKEGSKYHYCTRCGEKADLEVLPIDSEAHSFGGWVATDATCTENGEKHRECADCGAKTEDTVLSATGHSYGEYIIDKEATCTTTGSKHKECANCGGKTEAETIPATGHVASEWLTVSETEKQKKCTVCGTVLETEETENVTKLDTPKVKGLKNDVDGVKLDWNEIQGAKGYIVYRKVKGGKWERIGKLSENSFVDKEATSGKAYYYAVKAYSGKIKSSYKSSKAIKYLEAPVVKQGEADSYGISITWNKVKGANQYIVYRKTATSGWVNLGKVKGTKYTDRYTKNGTEYYYTARATDGKTKSAFRDGVPAICLTAPFIKGVEGTADGIKLSWNEISGVEGYKVLRKVNKGKWETLGITSDAVFIDKTAKSGKTYEYAVKAYKGDLVSASSRSVSFSFLANPVLKEAKASDKNIEIKWGKVDGAEKYTVYRKTAESGWKKIGSTSKTSYVDSSAKKDVEYTYTVIANKKNCNSGYDETGVSAMISSPKKNENKTEAQNNKPGKPHSNNGWGPKK